MELVTTLATTVGSALAGTAEVASTAMAVGKAGLDAAAAGSGALSILQGGLTAASAIASIGAGLIGMSEANTQAALQEAEASSIKLESEAKAVEIRKRAVAQLAEQRVAFAASGVDISTGTPEALAEGVERERDYQLAIERENARIRALRSQLQASATRMRGRSELVTGVGRAAQLGAGLSIDIAKRG